MPPNQSDPEPTSSSSTMIPTLAPGPLIAWRTQTQDTAPGFVHELIDEFCSDVVTHLELIERAIPLGDTAACRFSAHRLRSSCNAIGAFRLASLFEELELLATHGAVIFLSSQFAKIRAEYARLELALEQQRY